MDAPLSRSRPTPTPAARPEGAGTDSAAAVFAWLAVNVLFAVALVRWMGE